MSEPEMKDYPRCAESVKAAAVVCRYCGHNFVSGNPGVRPSAPRSWRDRLNEIAKVAFGTKPAPPIPQQIVYVGPRENSFQSCMGCVGAGIVGLILLAALGEFLGKVGY